MMMEEKQLRSAVIPKTPPRNTKATTTTTTKPFFLTLLLLRLQTCGRSPWPEDQASPSNGRDDLRGCPPGPGCARSRPT